MSGVAGVYRRDGRAVTARTLDRLDEALRPRGPDGAGRWQDGPVGLCHRLRETTPEATPDYLPVEGDGLVVTADARLDNRAALVRQLDVPTGAPDGALLLAAYDRWGVRCPEYLLGAFAFVVWDEREGRLYMARDHMGVKPLAYADHDDVVTVASEPAVVLQHEAVPSALDERWIAEFLLGDFEDTERTIYEPIRRVPPAHYLVADGDGTRCERYWELEIDAARTPDTTEECAERFRELFREAVRCRLRGADPGGALLSGGLDSSSIACTAAEFQGQPVHTFSAYSEACPESDEREYIGAVLDEGAFEPHFVTLDDISPLVDREWLFRRQGSPVRASNHFIHWELFRRAQDAEVTIVLDGLHGDSVLSTGLDLLPMLGRTGEYLTLATEIEGLARQTNRGSRRSLLFNAVAPSAPNAIRTVWHRLFDGADESDDGLLHPDFAKRIERLDPSDGRPETLSQPEIHRQQLQHGLVPFSVESAERSAAAFGIEPRFPFLDKRLVEYCVSLPPGEKLKHGWPRYVLRNAMKGLPESVRWRGDKGTYGRIAVRGLREHERDRVEHRLGDEFEPLDGYVDRSQLRTKWTQLMAGNGERFAVWRALSLAEWLVDWDPDDRVSTEAGNSTCKEFLSDASRQGTPPRGSRSMDFM